MALNYRKEPANAISPETVLGTTLNYNELAARCVYVKSNVAQTRFIKSHTLLIINMSNSGILNQLTEKAIIGLNIRLACKALEPAKICMKYTKTTQA